MELPEIMDEESKRMNAIFDYIYEQLFRNYYLYGRFALKVKWPKGD